MQRKFERRAAAMLAVFALSCTALASSAFAQTPQTGAPAAPASPDTAVAQMAAQLPPPPMTATAPPPTQPPPPVVSAPVESSPSQTTATVAAPMTAPTAAPVPVASSAPTTPIATPAPAPPTSAPSPAALSAPPAGAPSALAAAKPPAGVQMAAPITTGDVGADYILGSADKIRLTVFGEPSLTGEYFVSTSGVVSLPLAGDVQAAGLTLRDFHDRVIKALQDGYLKDPKVSLEVLTFRPFYILGEVTKPGQYPYTSGLTVFNAVATAGGFTYRANTHKVLIKRATETAEHEVTLTADTTIAPGDTIRIPERFF